MTNSSIIELMAPSKHSMRPTGYVDRFAIDVAGVQDLTSAHNEDSGFLQYWHLNTPLGPFSTPVMALYATPGTLESVFHRRHGEHSEGAEHLNGELSGVVSHIGGSCMPSYQIIPVNPQFVPGSPVQKLALQKEQPQGHAAQLHTVSGGSPLKQQRNVSEKPPPHMETTSSEDFVRRSCATPVISRTYSPPHTHTHATDASHCVNVCA